MGKIVIHAPHAAGPHQFWHLQPMLRVGAHSTFKPHIPIFPWMGRSGKAIAAFLRTPLW